MTPQPTQAKTLEEAVNTFSLLPLRFPVEEVFYAPPKETLSEAPLEQLKVLLLTSTAFDKYLVVGQLGNGKSTEINKLLSDAEIVSKFQIISYSAGNSMEVYDATHTELILSLPRHLFKSLKHSGIELSASKEIMGWRKSIDIEETTEEKEEASLLGKLTVFFGGVESRIKSEHTVRQTVREKVKGSVSRLVELFNLALDEARQEIHKEILFAIDDLDKCPLKSAENIFVESGDLLGRLRSKILYTFPLHLYYSKHLQPIQNATGASPFPIPNYPILDRDTLKPDKKIINSLINNVIEKRVDISLFEKEALEAAVLGSGGLIRELIRILHDSCTYTLSKKGKKVTNIDVGTILERLRNPYRALDDSYFDALQSAKEKRKAAWNETNQELFYRLALVEYDTRRWVYPNYLILPLLEERKKVKKVSLRPKKARPKGARNK